MVAATSDPMPWSAALILAVTLTAAGWMIVASGLKARAGTLRPNAWIGIRIKRARQSEEAWRVAHRAAGAALAAAGTPVLAAGLFFLTRPTDEAGQAVVLVVMLWMLAATGIACIQAHRAVDALDD